MSDTYPQPFQLHEPHKMPRKLNIPNTIPPSQWCDFRRDYENGLSLREIAEKYICDPRTVRNAIITNKSSSELGQQMAPTKLTPFKTQILELSKTMSAQQITENIRESGYTGCERTVRNYLKKQQNSAKR